VKRHLPLLLALSLSCSAALPGRAHEPSQGGTDARARLSFQQRKQLQQQRLLQKLAILQQSERCISRANNDEDLQACQEQARRAHRQLYEQRPWRAKAERTFRLNERPATRSAEPRAL
jgi:hypothetical protein